MGRPKFWSWSKIGGDTDYIKVGTQTFDLMGKIKAPVADDISLYAKLGVDYMLTELKRTGTGTATDINKNTREFGVAYGAGIDYSITPNIIANLEWLRHNGKVKASTDNADIQPFTDAFMVGLRYKFDM